MNLFESPKLGAKSFEVYDLFKAAFDFQLKRLPASTNTLKWALPNILLTETGAVAYT